MIPRVLQPTTSMFIAAGDLVDLRRDLDGHALRDDEDRLHDPWP